MKLPTVSVVIIAYNEEDYIKECLKSVKAQTHQPDEIVLIDNNCTDRTVEYAKKFSKVNVVREMKQGIIAARTAGFNSASSEFVFRIDADAILKPEALEMCLKKVVEDEAAALSPRVHAYDMKMAGIDAKAFNWLVYSLNKTMLGTNVLLGNTMLVKKSAWDEIEARTSRSEKVWEDLDITMALHEKGFKISHIKDQLSGMSFRTYASTSSGIAKRMTYMPRTLWKYSKIKSIGSAFAMLIIAVILFIPWLIERVGYDSSRRTN